jgi:hypothetical protein
MRRNRAAVLPAVKNEPLRVAAEEAAILDRRCVRTARRFHRSGAEGRSPIEQREATLLKPDG